MDYRIILHYSIYYRYINSINMYQHSKLILGDLISLIVWTILMPIKYSIVRQDESSYLGFSILIGLMIVVCIILKLFEKHKRELTKKESSTFIWLATLSTLISFIIFIFLGPCQFFFIFTLFPIFYTGRLIKFYLSEGNNQVSIISEVFGCYL